MSANDRCSYLQFYGIKIEDWSETFGAFANHHYILVPDYISDGARTDDDTAANGTHEFLYPAHIKKRYWIEGRIQGEFCLTASGATATIDEYRVTICKVHDDGTKTELASTGWLGFVETTLGWDSVHSVGDEYVYHFWIDCFQEKEITDYERIFLKIQLVTDANTIIMHSNDPSWTDVWFELPLRM